MITPENLRPREEAAKLYEEMVAADEEVNDAPAGMSDADYAMLDTKAERARAAFEAHPLSEELTYVGGEVERCAMSSVPILETDECELVLRSALGLPPRETEEEKQLLPDMVGV